MRRQTADTATDDRRGRHHRIPRLPYWLHLSFGTLILFALFMLPDLIAPARAQAFNPVDALGDGFDFLNPANLAKDAIEKAGTEAAGAIQDAFFWMLNQIFGGIQATLSVKLLTWLTRLPDFSGGQVMQVERAIQIGAGACLGAVLTISIVRFWLGSHSSNGGVSAGLEGVMRTAVAALLIGLWPKIFAIGVGLSNGFTSVLLNDAARDRLEDLFQGLDMASLGLPAAGGATAGAIGLFIGAGISALIWIILSTASAALFLALIAMKVIVTAGTVIAFVAMPMALVLWPIPETSWVATMLAKALAVLLAIPILWVLIFAAASAVGADVFFLSNNGKNENFLATGLNILLIKPLVACALLYLAVMLPSRLVRMAPLTGGARIPGGGAARAVTSYATYRGLEKVTSSSGVSSAVGAARQAATTAFGPGAQTAMAAAGAGAGAGSAATTNPGAVKGAAAAGQNQSANNGTQAAKAAGAAAGMAAGASAAGPAGAAAGGAAGGEIGGAAAGMAASKAAQVTSRDNVPVSDFENAPDGFKRADGGPAAMAPTSARATRVNAEHERMQNMSAADRPTQAQTQQAWETLGGSPSAQNAIRTASANPSIKGGTPHELADWSTSTENPKWGTQAEDATRVIGEASPSVRESVVTGGQGYANFNNNGGGGTAFAGGTNPPAAPAQTTTPRPANTTKHVPSATENHQRSVKRES